MKDITSDLKNLKICHMEKSKISHVSRGTHAEVIEVGLL